MKTPIEIVAQVTGRTIEIVTSDRKQKWVKPDEAIKIAEVYHAQFTPTVLNKTKPVCPVCGSDDIVTDANACWDVDTQEWVVQSTFDDMYCCKCEKDISIVNWIEGL